VSLLRSRQGTTALEFAFVAIPFMVLLVGIIELAWQLTTAAALDAATLRAARFGITGQATLPGEPAQDTCRSQTIKWVITASTGGFLSPTRVNVTTGAYGNASGLSGATTDSSAGIGGQIVTYQVTYTQPFLTGAWVSLIGGPAAITHQATVVVKNEPFDDNAPC
jgi:Flp pilus assembly protein TadG